MLSISDESLLEECLRALRSESAVKAEAGVSLATSEPNSPPVSSDNNSAQLRIKDTTSSIAEPYNQGEHDAEDDDVHGPQPAARPGEYDVPGKQPNSQNAQPFIAPRSHLLPGDTHRADHMLSTFKQNDAANPAEALEGGILTEEEDDESDALLQAMLRGSI